MGASDNSYGCVFQKEDAEGVTGAPPPNPEVYTCCP